LIANEKVFGNCISEAWLAFKQSHKNWLEHRFAKQWYYVQTCVFKIL
jgi:hypothetical protein